MRRLPIIAGVTALVVGASAAGYALSNEGEIGPAQHETANGRVLHPAGVMTPVGNFPTGGALTPNGRFYWAVSTGRGYNDVRIVNVRTNRLVQIVPLPGASGGIAMDGHRPFVYVSGVHDSRDPSETRNKSLQGRKGDVVHVLRYNAHTGRAHYVRKLKVQPPTGSPAPQQYPPNPKAKPKGWPDRLAYSAKTHKLLVPLNLADRAVILDVRTHKKIYSVVGHYPYGAAIVNHGATGLVSNEADGTVSVINMANGLVTKTIRVGPPLSHPESITIDPQGDGRAYVTMANTDHIAVISLRTMKTVSDFSLRRAQGLGVSPVAAAFDGTRHRLYVAEEGADDIAVLAVRRTVPRLIGRIPTAALPTDVATAHGRVVWLSGKGFGFGPNLRAPQPYGPRGGEIDIDTQTYLPAAIRGDVGVLRIPGRTALSHLTPIAAHQMIPVDRTQPPAHTPLRPGGPIKHVFFVVKENRTYDQLLGDDPRGDGDPHLELFGSAVTPNVHALVRRFPLLDHVYANSEASVDGHYWMSAASVPDYVQKNWMQFYGARGRPNDFGFFAVAWPGNGFLFDQALRQNISFFNYGEALAGELPLPDKDRTAAMTKTMAVKLAHSDLGTTTSGVGVSAAGHCYTSDSAITHDFKSLAQAYDSSKPTGASATTTSRFSCFQNHLNQQLATNTVPAFNYLVLPNDHTVGTTPGQRTPQAMMADNDYGLGQIVDLISHSSIWKSSAIFVVEDDSQNGSDHVDAHRIPAEVISPFTRQGAVIHHRYDFLSVVRSMELILGMEPLGLNDAVAEPMYGVFTSRPGNAAAYQALAPQQSRTQFNSSSAPDGALSASFDFRDLDQVPQAVLDRILWHAVHGEDSTPPPPGPHGEDQSQDP